MKRAIKSRASLRILSLMSIHSILCFDKHHFCSQRKCIIVLWDSQEGQFPLSSPITLYQKPNSTAGSTGPNQVASHQIGNQVGSNVKLCKAATEGHDQRYPQQRE